RQGDQGRVQLQLGLDVAGAVAAPVDARTERREVLEREVAGDGLGVGLAPAVLVVGDRRRASQPELEPAPQQDRRGGGERVASGRGHLLFGDRTDSTRRRRPPDGRGGAGVGGRGPSPPPDGRGSGSSRSYSRARASRLWKMNARGLTRLPVRAS